MRAVLYAAVAASSFMLSILFIRIPFWLFRRKGVQEVVVVWVMSTVIAQTIRGTCERRGELVIDVVTLLTRALCQVVLCAPLHLQPGVGRVLDTVLLLPNNAPRCAPKEKES
jgi:hypothetical protein